MLNIVKTTTPDLKSAAIAVVVLFVFCGCQSPAVNSPTAKISAQEKIAPDATAQESLQDAQQAISSEVPDTDIFLFEIDLDSAATPAKFIGNVTQRPGYDNQPGFIRGTNDFLFSSIVDNRQSDVYLYRSATGQITKITDTSLSEYSPTPLQNGDFSCVTVEQDGAQRLWRFNRHGNPVGKIRADLTDVGYHAFLPGKRTAALLAVFRVTDPVRLDVVAAHARDGSDDQVRTLATGIGRSLHAIPNSPGLSFVQHTPDQPSMLMKWNSLTNQVTPLIAMPSQVEDMAWSGDGRALAVADGRLISWSEGDQQWSALYDLKSYLPFATTRLSVNDSGTRLAVVMEMESP